MNDLALGVDLDDASHAALGDHRVSVGQSGEGVDIDPLAAVSVHGGGVVGPDHLLVQGHLGELGPTVVVEDVAIGQQMHVVMARVSPLRPAGLVRPQHVALGVGDGQNVLAVRGADQNEPLGLSARASE